MGFFIYCIHFLLYLNEIYHLDIFKTTNWREKKTSLSIISSGQKFFVRFLVQVKIVASPFEINWPLVCNSQIYGGDFAKVCGLLRIYEFYLFFCSPDSTTKFESTNTNFDQFDDEVVYFLAKCILMLLKLEVSPS